MELQKGELGMVEDAARAYAASQETERLPGISEVEREDMNTFYTTRTRSHRVVDTTRILEKRAD